MNHSIMWHNNRVEVFKSAVKHGVTAEESLYVVGNALRCLYLSDTPEKRLYLGFSASGMALEVITLNTSKIWGSDYPRYADAPNLS